MRSREEVRWAEWFDTQALPWDYEPVTFGRKRRYTPDFLLRGAVFVEVKSRPSVGFNDFMLCRAPLILVMGHPDDKPDVRYQAPLQFGLRIAPDWRTAFGMMTALCGAF